MKDLSIVIVNYNVRHFLQQTLESVRRASKNLQVEIWVVDNHSIDDSVEMVQTEFPEVNLIANQDNPGFSKANNQAILKSNAKYILLLNPDTVLQEDTLDMCFSFMNNHPDAGAVGAKMIDGSGQFLPESKRGFPSPWTSFCKATGLSVLFPKSKTFNQYHLGFLPENETNKIDVLCGAFMFMRSAVLDEIGLLDEAFFMYGEDIDLSYRIKKSGNEIYYYPDTQLIHFKGESTKKSSVNYVKVFYKAMIIFAKKHFSGNGAGFLVFLLNVAIFGRATVSLIKRFTKVILPQIIDFTLIFVGLIVLKEWWESFHFGDKNYFSNHIYYALSCYSLFYVISLYVHGVYRERYSLGQLFRAIFIGVLILLAIYGLVNQEYRFSRALLLMSGFWAILSTLSLRLLRQYLSHGDFRIGRNISKRIFVIGNKLDAENVIQLLKKGMTEHKVVAKIAPKGQYDASFHDTKWSNIAQLAEMEKANEFIFCINSLEWNEVMPLMNSLGSSIEYKMVGDDNMSILGSKSKNTAGELYSVHFQFNISRWQEKWKKRFLDIALSLLCMLFFFIFIWFQKEKASYISRLIQVLTGKRSFVGYHKEDKKLEELPPLKMGLKNPVPHKITDKELIHRANLLYAKEYSVWKDLEIIIRKM